MTNKLVKQTGAAVGWNAGGISVISLAGDLVVKFTMVAGSDWVLGGLAPAGTTPTLAGVQHGFRAAEGGYLEVVESGVVKATTDVLFTTNTQVGIYRLGTTIYYAVDEWRYQSTVASSGAKSLLGVLYAPGDAIDVPSISSYVADISSASLEETLTASDGYYTDPYIYGGITDILTFSSAVGGAIEITAGLPEFLTVLDSTSPQLTLVAALTSTLAFTDTASASNQALLQYATNLVSGAVSRYNGFEFTGFCRVGMDTYGFKQDGLYKIGADTDDDAPITALIEFAAEALAGTMQSRLVALFYGLATDGQVFVRVIDDADREVVYRARNRQNQFRANPYQGINSRHWRMRLEVVDATYAELDTVEWVAASTNKRTTT